MYYSYFLWGEDYRISNVVLNYGEILAYGYAAQHDLCWFYKNGKIIYKNDICKICIIIIALYKQNKNI